MTPTVTPYPTLTPFPTAVGTPVLDFSAVAHSVHASQLGPQVVQSWNMTVGPHWELLSGLLLIGLVMGTFFVFYVAFVRQR